MTDYNAMDNDELSAEVARRLFGTRCVCATGSPADYEGELEWCPIHGYNLRPYASDHNAAMGLVVPEMRKRGWHFCLDEKNEQVLASFWRWQVAPSLLLLDSNAVAPFGQEPRGICLAAMAAKDAEEGRE